MFRLKTQYLFSFAVNGCLVPFVPLYLRQKGLGDSQMSSVMAISGLAVMLSPVLMTFVADRHLDARRVMGVLLLASAVCLVFIPALGGFAPILAGFLLLNILFVSVMPLQDGLNLAMQEERRAAGAKPAGYHSIRVWGTVGFLVPGLLLYLLVSRWSQVTAVLYVAAGFALVAGLNVLLLPHVGGERQVAERKLPTFEAAGILFGRKMLLFCLAMFLLQMAAASYYTFYPLYLSTDAGIPQHWAGMVMNIGVLIEIAFMLSFGRLLDWLGPRRFLLAGCVVMAIRMLLLAAFTSPIVAIGIQLMHGMMVLLLHVGPVVLIDRLAENRFRHSMQGLYAMTVLGGGRILGNLAAGPIARYGYQATYWWAAGLVGVATILLAVGYFPQRKEQLEVIAGSADSEGA